MMDCERLNHLLDSYLDGTLDAETARDIENHGKECAACAALLALGRDLRRDEGEVPASFSAGWRKVIRKESTMEKKQQTKHTLRSVLLAAAAFLFIVGGTALTREKKAQDTAEQGNYNYTISTAANGSMSAKQRTLAAATYDAAPQEEPMVMYSMDMAAEEKSTVSGAGEARETKLIKHVDFTIKTLNFDQVVENLQAITGEYGGRIEHISQYGDRESGALRNASLVLRIPAERLDAFLSHAEEVGNVTSFTSYVEDVSDRYYDVQARLDTQLTKMERLQALLAEAELVSDLIEIENSIADTQYMIDSYQGSLKGMDDKVDYSTVSIYVQESRVVETKEASFLERIGAGITESLELGFEFLQDSCIFLIAALPWIAVVVLIAVVVRQIRKRKK